MKKTHKIIYINFKDTGTVEGACDPSTTIQYIAEYAYIHGYILSDIEITHAYRFTGKYTKLLKMNSVQITLQASLEELKVEECHSLDNCNDIQEQLTYCKRLMFEFPNVTFKFTTNSLWVVLGAPLGSVVGHPNHSKLGTADMIKAVFGVDCNAIKLANMSPDNQKNVKGNLIKLLGGTVL